MPSPNPPSVQSLLTASNCLACIPNNQLLLIQTEVLIQLLLIANPMADTSIQGLLAQSNCLACIPPNQLALIQTQLLIQLLVATQSGTGGTGGVECGIVNPVAAPTNTCTLFYNTANQSLWYWDAAGVKWQALIQ